MTALTEERASDLRAELAHACRAVDLDPSGAQLITYSSNVVYRLRDNVIARMNLSSTAHKQAALLVRVAQWLEKQNAPIASLLPGHEQPVLLSKSATTFWSELVIPKSVNAAHLAKTLLRFHDLTAPKWLPKWDKFAWAKAYLDQASEISTADRDWLRAAWAEVEQDYVAASPRMPHGVIHGDAHIGNMLRTPEAEPVLCDLDNVSWGPIDWDLTPITVSAIRFNRPAEHRAFVSEYGRDVTATPWWSILRRIRELVMVTYIVNDLCGRPEVAKQWTHRMRTLKEGQDDARWQIL